MSEEQKKRVRRSPEQARQHILSCAEEILIKQGIQAVEVRAVARAASMTDAGINHHFGSLNGLLEALMTEGARKVRQAVENVVADWIESGPDIASLVEAIGKLYRDGYAALAIQLHKSGWQERGTPLLAPVIEPLMAINRNAQTTEKDLKIALASLHLWLAFDPLYGNEFRRSVGLHARNDRAAQLDWWSQSLTRMLT